MLVHGNVLTYLSKHYVYQFLCSGSGVVGSDTAVLTHPLGVCLYVRVCRYVCVYTQLAVVSVSVPLLR